MDIGGWMLNIVMLVILLGGFLLTVIGLPGNWLIFFTALGYGFYYDFTGFTVNLVLLLLGLLLVGEIVEFIAGALGARKQKASTLATVAAFIGGITGAVAGTAVLPIIGSLLGAFAGAFGASYLAEYLITGNRDQSHRVAKSVLIGQVAGMVVKMAIAIAMAITIAVHLIWNKMY